MSLASRAIFFLYKLFIVSAASFHSQELPMSVDLTNAESCSKYKYICARVRKDSPTPDYKLVGKNPAAIVGCAPVTCESK